MSKYIFHIKYILVFFIIFSFNVGAQLIDNDKEVNKKVEVFVSINGASTGDYLSDVISNIKIDKIENNEGIENILYGYANVFLADVYNRNKYYISAAETIKRAFFNIDETIELNTHDWRFVYLRLRMDAFTPNYLGRCVIALKDSEYLLLNNEVNSELFPMIEYMYARSLMNCKKKEKAKNIIDKLLNDNKESRKIAKYGFYKVPLWLEVEKKLVIRPLFLENYK